MMQPGAIQAGDRKEATDTVLSLDDKQRRLESILRDLGSVAVAFSAGADSTFVLKTAIDVLGPRHVVAVTGRSDSLARAEFQQACKLADEVGAEHVILDTDEFQNDDYLANPVNRCYFCKSTLFAHLERFIAHRGINAIVTGTNADDLSDVRPGLQAADEHAVRAPAAEAGLTKCDIRALSAKLGLPTHDKPASPCLSSRVQYGEAITPEKLRRIEEAEAFLRETFGIRECRVRHHERLARIEVAPHMIPTLAAPENAARIEARLRALGFNYVSLDLRGFRSGSMNEVIPLTAPTPKP